jgi:hypothetical protein
VRHRQPVYPHPPRSTDLDNDSTDPNDAAFLARARTSGMVAMRRVFEETDSLGVTSRFERMAA